MQSLRQTMTDASPLHLTLSDADATAALGRSLAGVLGPGDAVLLSGTLGAGKSTLARALIRAVLSEPEAEVPSPSYTLVNVYETPEFEIWHADLYRLGGGDEIAELGLGDAAGAILLVEWPDRMGEDCPERRLEILLEPQPDDSRRAEIRCIGSGWDTVVDALAGGS